MNVTTHFTENELGCSHCAQNGEVNLGPWAEEGNQLLLEQVRTEFGHPMPVNSGYRCPNHPIELAKENGPGSHTNGLGLDVAVYNERALRLTLCAFYNGWLGIRWQQKGNLNSRFVHMDRAESRPEAPRPHAGSY